MWTITFDLRKDLGIKVYGINGNERRNPIVLIPWSKYGPDSPIIVIYTEVGGSGKGGYDIHKCCGKLAEWNVKTKNPQLKI
jgi:hypothetical protein